MRIERRFTKPGQSAYAEIEFTRRFQIKSGWLIPPRQYIDVPAQFSQVADILAQYFRKARARAPEEGRGKRRSLFPLALRRRRS